MVPIWSQVRSSRRAGGSLAVLAGTVAGLALAAISAVLPVAAEAATAKTCPEPTLVQPFVKWADSNYYSLVAGGSFEAGETPWTLSGGATVASGSETYAVTGKLGKSSLDLPQGSSAQAPFTCIEPNDRTFRLFARSEGKAATVRVSVVFQTYLGEIALPVGNAVTTSSWEPTAAFHTGVLIGALLSEGSVHVALRFTSTSGVARIDDVYIDPRMRR
jgi:hypothetical protein